MSITPAELVARVLEPRQEADSSLPLLHARDSSTSDTSVLIHDVVGRLQASQGVRPILVSPPRRFLDTGAVALMQAAVGLMSNGFANGALSQQLLAPQPWREKFL